MQLIALTWIGLFSIWSFAAMGLDKRQAKKKEIRIPEKNLWILALIGGGLGAYLGMQVFRHKTRHTSFRIGFLLLALIYGVVIIYLFGFRVPGISVY